MDQILRIRYPDTSSRVGDIDGIIDLFKQWLNSVSRCSSTAIIENHYFSVYFCVVDVGKCVMMTKPKDNNEDSMITKNGTSCKDHEATIRSQSPFSFSYLPVNVVKIDDGVDELTNILRGKERMLCWHAY